MEKPTRTKTESSWMASNPLLSIQAQWLAAYYEKVHLLQLRYSQVSPWQLQSVIH